MWNIDIICFLIVPVPFNQVRTEYVLKRPICYILFMRQTGVKTPYWEKVRNEFQVSTLGSLQVQKSEPRSAEQV